jgi:hypothetical protein
MNSPNLEILKYVATAIIALLPLLFALPASLKTWKELGHLLRAHRRDECEFALRMVKEIADPNIKGYAEELAYAALTGDRHLNHGQRKVLLSMRNAEQRIAAYMSTRQLVAVSTELQGFSWKKRRHARAGYRRFLRISYFGAYLLLCMLAFSPWLFWGFTKAEEPMPTGMVALQAMALVYFLSPAIYVLNAGVRLNDAQKLMLEVANDPVNQA